MKAMAMDSMLHSSAPRRMRKKPSSPHDVPQLFFTRQYGSAVTSSTPHLRAHEGGDSRAAPTRQWRPLRDEVSIEAWHMPDAPWLVSCHGLNSYASRALPWTYTPPCACDGGEANGPCVPCS